jgi:hypothetical protein
MRDQPASLIGPHLIFLDRPLDGRLFVRRIDDDADELRRRVLEVVDGLGMPARRLWLLLFGWSFRHGDSLATSGPDGDSTKPKI